MKPPNPTGAQPLAVLAVCVICPGKIKRTVKQRRLAQPRFSQQRGPDTSGNPALRLPGGAALQRRWLRDLVAGRAAHPAARPKQAESFPDLRIVSRGERARAAQPSARPAGRQGGEAHAGPRAAGNRLPRHRARPCGGWRGPPRPRGPSGGQAAVIPPASGPGRIPGTKRRGVPRLGPPPARRAARPHRARRTSWRGSRRRLCR